MPWLSLLQNAGMDKNLFVYNGVLYEGEMADKYRSRAKIKQMVDNLNKEYPQQVIKTLRVKDSDNFEQDEEQITAAETVQNLSYIFRCDFHINIFIV